MEQIAVATTDIIQAISRSLSATDSTRSGARNPTDPARRLNQLVAADRT
jgi:hypothetical protein